MASKAAAIVESAVKDGANDPGEDDGGEPPLNPDEILKRIK